MRLVLGFFFFLFRMVLKVGQHKKRKELQFAVNNHTSTCTRQTIYGLIVSRVVVHRSQQKQY